MSRALALLTATLMVAACGDSPNEPLTSINDLLEVQVLDDTVVVTRDPVYSSVHFTPRLRLHNRSTNLALRWGGCAWLDLRRDDGERALDQICSTELRPDDRPVLQPGETRELAVAFNVCTRDNCVPRLDLDAVDGEYRFVASFGSHLAVGMRTLTGIERAGMTTSNSFVMRLVE